MHQCCWHSYHELPSRSLASYCTHLTAGTDMHQDSCGLKETACNHTRQQTLIQAEVWSIMAGQPGWWKSWNTRWSLITSLIMCQVHCRKCERRCVLGYRKMESVLCLLKGKLTSHVRAHSCNASFCYDGWLIQGYNLRLWSKRKSACIKD